MSQNQNTIAATGAPIWENLYAVKVPYIATLSEERLRTSGVLSTGNKLLDASVQKGSVRVMITINDIVEYFRKGVSVTFAQPADTREIYDIVNNYLLAWRQHADNGINMGNVPVEDLLLLDNFAEMIWPLAAKFGAIKPVRGSSFTSLLDMGSGHLLSRSSFRPDQESDGLPEKHANHAKDLVKSLARLSGGW